MNKPKQNKNHRCKEQNGGCQRGRGRKVGEMGKGGQEVQTYIYKTEKPWGCNVQHGDYSQ